MAYIKAYGNKRVYPKNEPMTETTVFDMASCSKAMSTAVCAMTLIDQGKIRLQDRVDQYVPGFEGWTDEKGGKTAIRIIDLMTHTSGLPAYADANMLKEKFRFLIKSYHLFLFQENVRDYIYNSEFQQF